MAQVLTTWKEPSSRSTYVSTGKEAGPECGKMDLACYILAGKIDDEFRGEPATLKDIYYNVMRPMGMSLNDTTSLVKEAKSRGYLK